MCGAARINEFEQAWIDQVRKSQPQPLTPAQETEIRGWLDRADKMATGQFQNQAAKDEYCRKHPVDQSLIDRGIAGDFAGMI